MGAFTTTTQSNFRALTDLQAGPQLHTVHLIAPPPGVGGQQPQPQQQQQQQQQQRECVLTLRFWQQGAPTQRDDVNNNRNNSDMG